MLRNAGFVEEHHDGSSKKRLDLLPKEEHDPKGDVANADFARSCQRPAPKLCPCEEASAEEAHHESGHGSSERVELHEQSKQFQPSARGPVVTYEVVDGLLTNGHGLEQVFRVNFTRCPRKTSIV